MVTSTIISVSNHINLADMLHNEAINDIDMSVIIKSFIFSIGSFHNFIKNTDKKTLCLVYDKYIELSLHSI